MMVSGMTYPIHWGRLPVRPRPANPKSPSVFIIVGVAYVEAGPCSFANLEGSVCAVHCRRGANE